MLMTTCMKMKQCVYRVASRLAAVVLLLAATSPAAAQEASFQGLGNLPGGSFYSYASGVSDDGSVVVGESISGSSYEAFRWTAGSGMVGLGYLPGGAFSSQARAVSADGSVIVGQSRSASGNEAFRWTAGSGMIRLDVFLDFLSQATGVSADGSVIVGLGYSASGLQAFRWMEDGGVVGLGDLPGGSFFSQGYAVSADGSVVVGESSSSPSLGEAFRWTTGGGMVGLGGLPGDSVSSYAVGVSDDGSVVVGTASDTKAFRWTSGGGMVDLGYLSEDVSSSQAYAVSGDGSIVVGTSYSASGFRAFIWDAANGMRSLQQVLENDFDLDLTGWHLFHAYGISADGLVIVGDAINPSHKVEAFRVQLGSPNHGPEVTCPVEVAAECVNGGANLLVGAEVFDADGDPLWVEWKITYPDLSVTTIADTVTFADPPLPVAIALIDPSVSPSGFIFPYGNSTVELSVSDGVAETEACSPVTISVKDTAGPVIVTLMKRIEVGNDPGECFATVDLDSDAYRPRISNLCSPAVRVTHNHSGTFPMGNTEVTWTFKDGYGNETNATQTVIVSDTEAPIATAAADIVVAHDVGGCYATVSLGSPVTTDNCGVANVSNDSSGTFPLGDTKVQWFVSDAAGNTIIVTQLVTVTNAVPVADAGVGKLLPRTSPAGAKYELNGTRSSDPDLGDTERLSFQWSAVDGNGFPILFDDDTRARPSATFPIGSTTVTLVVTDICGATVSDCVIIAVEDANAPVIDVMVTDRDILQVPNHKMIPVNIELLVRDTCVSPEALQVVCVATSDEPDDGKGDGSFTGDVNGADGYSASVPVSMTFNSETGRWEGTVYLRSEQDGAEAGRKYALICTVTDLSGNSSTATACIVVPHDRRGKK